MSWSAFKSSLLPQMKGLVHGNSMPGFAQAFTQAYDIAAHAGKSTVTQIPLMKGNPSAMQSLISNFLTSTQMSKQLTLLDIIGPAVIMYWTGAMLMPIPPGIPCPGTISNVSVLAAPVLSPGSWTKMPVQPNNDPSIFLDTFINSAKIHVTTLSGLHNCISLYPGAPPVPGPCVEPWSSFTIPG